MASRPPRAFSRLVGWLLPSDIRDETLAELADRFAEIEARDGALAACRWYRRQARRCLVESPSRAWQAVREAAGELAGGDPGRDVVLALRGLGRAPGFSAATVVVLALGIGGTAAVWSVVSGILLRPLPYVSPERLAVAWTFNERQQQRDGSSHLNTDDWLARSRTIDDIALYVRPAFTSATLVTAAHPTRVLTGQVTANFFSVLGVTAVEGRLFGPGDLTRDTQVAVVRPGFLDRIGRLGERETVLEIDGQRVIVVGVAPPTLTLPTAETDVWLLHDPRAAPPMMQTRRNDTYVALLRVRPGFDVAAAAAELGNIARQLAVEHPDTNAALGVSVAALRDELLGDRVPLILWLLLAAVLLLLLVSATNAGHLILMRAIRRKQEYAVRAAMGASSLRIGRQLMIEGLSIGVLSVLAGSAAGAIGLELLVAAAPPGIPHLDRVVYDARALGAGALAALAVAPVFAVLPAWTASRQSLSDSLRAGGRHGGRPHRRLVRTLVVVELMLAVVLLAETGLILRSARAAVSVDPGFDHRRVLLATVDLDGRKYDTAVKQQLFYDDVLARIEALPGVEAAGAVDDFFLSRFPDQTIVLDGQASRFDLAVPPRLTTDMVQAGFFRVMGLALEEGRLVGIDSRAPVWPPREVVINRSMADAFWPGRSAVGQRFWFRAPTAGDPGVVVAGVVSDARRDRLEALPFPTAYALAPALSMDLMVRTAGDPTALAAAIRQVVNAVDPLVPVSAVRSAWSAFQDSLAARYFQVWLLGTFAALTILLAATGLFALLSEAVLARRREIGVRLALGATPSSVRRLVLKEGLTLGATGLGLGLAGAWMTGRLTEHLLFGITPTDPVTLVVVAAGLLLIAGLASWLPAFRASRVAPAVTLCAE